jgi:uncharacterized phage protein (TIGR02220 family)
MGMWTSHMMLWRGWPEQESRERQGRSWISLSQFVEGTGLNKPHICGAVKKLIDMHLISKEGGITEKGNDGGSVYRFERDFRKWTPLPKKVMLPKKVKGFTEKGKRSLPKMVPTKETLIQKKLLQKKDSILLLSSDEGKIFKEVIDYLNESTGTNFRSDNTSTIFLLKERLGEGFTVDDFRKVIDLKVKEWSHDGKMAQYLRPKTLFSEENFENYLNQLRTSDVASEDPIDRRIAELRAKYKKT